MADEDGEVCNKRNHSSQPAAAAATREQTTVTAKQITIPTAMSPREEL